MRVRSVALVFSMSGLLAGSILRCSPPPLPLGPQANPTTIKTLHGAVLKVPASGAIDRPALLASLKEANLNTVILESSATGVELVSAQVSLAVDLQNQLDGRVYLGTDEATAHSTVDALRTADPSKRIGCFIAQQPLLVDRLADDAKATLNAQLRAGASACVAEGRHVAVSLLLTTRSGDPDTAGLVLREVLRDTGISVVMLDDGAATLEDAGQPDAGLRRARGYYQGLRNALTDRQVELGGALLVGRLVDGGEAPRTMEVWANIEAFECVPPSCAMTHPTTADAMIEQLCGARGRVDSIVVVEYLHDLAERPLIVFDASSDTDAALPDDLQAILDDSDAAAQLRKGYLEWRDSGARCPP